MADAFSPGNVVILGNGVASLAAIATLRQRGFGGKITVVSDEPHHAYARMLVPYYVSGRLARDRLFLVAPDYHRSLGVDLVLGSGAAHVDTEGRRVVLAGGGEVPYDRLLVATGSRPTMPAMPGIGGQGVLGLRSMTDAEGISSLVLPGQPAVVLGGGPVSLMAAEALHARGMAVTVVIASSHPLSQLMTAEAAHLVEPGLAAEGLDVRTLRDVTEVILDGSGSVSAVRLDNGEVLPCRLLVVGRGIRPCLEFMQKTGVTLHPGVKVNRFLESDIAGVFAAGDVALAPDLLDDQPLMVATQLNAIRQGRVAALNILGIPFADDGGLPLNTTHFGGVRVITCGHTGHARPEEREEIVCREGAYRRYLIRDDRLVGITLVGDVTNAGRLVSLIQGRMPLNGKLERVMSNTLAGFRQGETS